jgi:hypothetical protein
VSAVWKVTVTSSSGSVASATSMGPGASTALDSWPTPTSTRVGSMRRASGAPTVSMALAVALPGPVPTVARMTASPGERAVTSPVAASTDATSGRDEIQATATPVPSSEPPASRATAVNCCVQDAGRDADAGTTSSRAARRRTTARTESLALPGLDATTHVAPSSCAVTTPTGVTRATRVSRLTQIAVTARSPPEPTTHASTVRVAPA